MTVRTVKVETKLSRVKMAEKRMAKPAQNSNDEYNSSAKLCRTLVVTTALLNNTFNSVANNNDMNTMEAAYRCVMYSRKSFPFVVAHALWRRQMEK